MVMFLVLFGLQVIRYGTPQVAVNTTVPLDTDAAVLLFFVPGAGFLPSIPDAF